MNLFFGAFLSGCIALTSTQMVVGAAVLIAAAAGGFFLAKR